MVALTSILRFISLHPVSLDCNYYTINFGFHFHEYFPVIIVKATIRASDGATIIAFLPPGEVCEE